MSSEELSELNRELLGRTIVREVVFDEVPGAAVHHVRLTVFARNGDRRTPVTVALEAVDLFEIRNFGGGITQLLCLQVRDTSDHGPGSSRFEVNDLERGDFRCVCRLARLWPATGEADDDRSPLRTWEMTNEELAGLNERCRKYPVVRTMAFSCDPVTGVCDVRLTVAEATDGRSSAVTLVLEGVANLEIHNFGGVGPLLSLQIRDVSHQQLDRLSFEVNDANGGNLGCLCRRVYMDPAPAGCLRR